MARDKDNGFGEWGGYMDAKISKLEEQYSRSTDPFRESNLFAGISIFVNGLTNPSADELKHIMMQHGGVFHHYERKHTKFIIASNLPDVKIRKMDTSKIISANWIVDCLKENKILDYSNYLLYTNRKKTQPGLFFAKKTPTKNNNFKTKDALNEKKSINSVSDVKVEIEQSIEKATIQKNMEYDKKILKNTCNKYESNIDNDQKQSDKNDNYNNADNIEIEKIMQDLQKLNNKIRKRALEKDLNKPTYTTEVNENISANNKVTGSVARTANHPNFLSEFYNNSRLHHISTLGASFKQLIHDLREGNPFMKFPARKILKDKLKENENFHCYRTVVMHIDMDCFFVSVGLRTYPHLKGKPVAVTHSKGNSTPTIERPGVNREQEMNLYMERLGAQLEENVKSEKIKMGFEGKDSLSEIASCSYEARKFGLRNGMFVGQALKLCPDLKTIPYDFDGYKEVATTLYNTIAQYTLNIEAVSCDEMFVDLTEILNELKIEPMEFVSFVREEVKEKTGCTCSAGVGANKLQARLATKNGKPNGQYNLNTKDIEKFMSEILISDLPGVGYSTTYSLKRNNLITCGDLQKISLPKIQCEVGQKFGETLYQFCRGIDNRPLAYEQIRKSVSAEVNYGIRFSDNVEMETFLKKLCGEVHSRLMEIKRKGKCITLKVMTRAKDAPKETAKFMGHGVCDNQSKSVTLRNPVDDLPTIITTVLATMRSLLIQPNELRGIGIQISKFDFPNVLKNDIKDNTLIKMFDKINSKQKEKNIETHIDLVEHVSKEDETTKSPSRLVQPFKVKSSSPQTKKRQTKKKPNINLKTMFENAPMKKKPRVDSICPNSFNDIDPKVLEELPIDIRNEILNNNAEVLASTNKNRTLRKPSKQTDEIKEFLETLNSDLRKEIENDLIQQKIYKKCDTDNNMIKNKRQKNNKTWLYSDHDSKHNNSTSISVTSNKDTEKVADSSSVDENIFLEPNVIELLTSWVSEGDPSDSDITFLSDSIAKLIRARKIYAIYEPIVSLKNLINSTNNCQWHTAYNQIIKNLQNEMRSIYGSRMLLDENLNCNKCY